MKNRRKFMLDYCLKVPLVGFFLLNLNACDWISQRFFPPTQFTARNLGVIVNTADPLSVQIAEYYQRQRKIPQQNIIKISFPANRSQLSSEEFLALQTKVKAQTPSQVEGYALTWAAPYRVGCMSITSAFAFGYDSSHCANGCKPTSINPYFNQETIHPYQDFKMRPTMMIAATNFTEAKKLIDHGVTSDATYPPGTAYLMDTSDKARNVRSQFYPAVINYLGSRLRIEIIKGDALENKTDVMFYIRDKPKLIKFRPINSDQARSPITSLPWGDNSPIAVK
jgi:uncharacterized protein (TIGR03790 family)